MTNREESSAAEHETFPGPGPLKADEAKRGIRPVEQMVDAAIERIARESIARETHARAAKAGSHPRPTASTEPSHAITLARADAAALMAMSQEPADSSEDSARAEGSQLARVTDRRGKGRLRWKGLEVSDEFRTYADRVARGEDLPPFTGKILAEPDPAFPWDPKAQQQAARRALKQQVGLWTGVALFLGLSVAVLIVQVRNHTDAWQAPESPLASVTMANQPGAEATSEAPTAANAPAAFSEPVVAPELATGGTAPAEPALQQAAREETAAVAAAAVPSAPVTSATARPANAVKAPAAASTGAGVFVATRAPAVPSNTAAATAAGSNAVTGSPNGTTASEPLRAVGTGGTPAASNVTAGADVAGASDPASALRADPKKEPTREASSMGSLLVESPSF